MRLEFANFIERDMQDEETALMIRQTLSSERVGVLIREFAIEMHRASGFEVSWEYVGGGEEDEEELDEDLMEDASGDEEDEDMLESKDADGEEDTESGSEYEPEGEDGEEEDRDDCD
jgi:hypothetical protein